MSEVTADREVDALDATPEPDVADKSDQPVEPEEKTLAFRVLRRDETTISSVTRWIEEPARIEGKYHPTATDVGEMFGEGDYLLIEVDPRYSFHSTYPMRVVAEKRFREAREDES